MRVTARSVGTGGKGAEVGGSGVGGTYMSPPSSLMFSVTTTAPIQ